MMTIVDVDFTPSKNRYDIPQPVPGPAWREALIGRYAARDGEIGLLINDLYFTADMFHMLPEYTDWKSIRRGDMTILGRVDLDWHMLDLVLMDHDGYLKAASIDFLSIWFKPLRLRTYLFHVWRQLPLILINRTPYQRSTK